MSLNVDYAAVYRAWRSFKKGKRLSRAIDEFAYNLETNLLELSAELTGGTYKHGGYQSVIILEKKRRDLAVAGVRDRVVHRLLYDYLVKEFDDSFDGDVWSCRIGKGLHGGLSRTQKLLGKYQFSYVWRADIIKFFDNVSHDALMLCLERKIGSDDTAKQLCREIISSYSIDRTEQNRTEQNRTEQNRTEQNRTEQNRTGIPIGNLTSQIFANIYLNELDRFVRHTLKPQAYIRYGDDFALFCVSRRNAFDLRGQTEAFLRDKLSLSIKPKNDIIIPAGAGLQFLGHNITSETVKTDKHTSKRVLSKVNSTNIASYKALNLPTGIKNRLDWVLVEKLDNIGYNC